MSIRKTKKALKNLKGYITISVYDRGFYTINDEANIVYHKDSIIISTDDFSEYFDYAQINRIIYEFSKPKKKKH
ncbi:hypothetical protein [Prevotella sp.]|nr:hypothetical protein [Prevotella sp.]